MNKNKISIMNIWKYLSAYVFFISICIKPKLIEILVLIKEFFPDVIIKHIFKTYLNYLKNFMIITALI